MRRHLAMTVDIDADVDAAKLGGIEPDFESGLAALGGGGDFHRKSAQRHRRVGSNRRGQLTCGNRRCGGGKWLRLDPAGSRDTVAGEIDRRLAELRRGEM